MYISHFKNRSIGTKDLLTSRRRFIQSFPYQKRQQACGGPCHRKLDSSHFFFPLTRSGFVRFSSKGRRMDNSNHPGVCTKPNNRPSAGAAPLFHHQLQSPICIFTRNIIFHFPSNVKPFSHPVKDFPGFTRIVDFRQKVL